jgi:uncharacterized protein YyaL (SSP411 family)
MGWRRFALLPAFATRDALRNSIERYVAVVSNIAEGAVDEGARWLRLTHDVTSRRGCSRGYSLVFGWGLPFPETTGYIIGTMLRYAARTGLAEYAHRAKEMGDWEVDVQNPDGGVIEGVFTGRPKPATVFNTGMVIHGWLDLYEAQPSEEHIDAAVRAGLFLTRHQDEDGAWRGDVEYFRIPHTYCARVSWALTRLADVTGEASFRTAAMKQLNWVLSMQRENGWFDSCFFTPRKKPSTHSIGYTLRGLLESSILLDEPALLGAVVKTSEVLIRKLEVYGGRLPATFSGSWAPAASYECLTGTAQLGIVWLRLFQASGDARFLNAGLKAIDRAATHQSRSSFTPIRGALPGSFPIYGRYAPLLYPNWATKFLVDALLLREEVLAPTPG